MAADQNIKNKTLVLEMNETQLMVGVWWIDMSHLAKVIFCNFAFILGSHYGEIYL